MENTLIANRLLEAGLKGLDNLENRLLLYTDPQQISDWWNKEFNPFTRPLMQLHSHSKVWNNRVCEVGELWVKRINE